MHHAPACICVRFFHGTLTWACGLQVTLADLHEVAAARLDGWAAWVTSRNTMDEGDDSDEEEDGKVPLRISCLSCIVAASLVVC
jgi:hypothetical protein